MIGEDGVRLSGGEKQRISIARAMLKKSSIILLDEATSSLDSETETKIQDALKILTKDKTTIVIAHRLSTILNSNKIYVIDSGKIIDNGKHEDLLINSKFIKIFMTNNFKGNDFFYLSIFTFNHFIFFTNHNILEFLKIKKINLDLKKNFVFFQKKEEMEN